MWLPTLHEFPILGDLLARSPSTHVLCYGRHLGGIRLVELSSRMDSLSNLPVGHSMHPTLSSSEPIASCEPKKAAN